MSDSPESATLTAVEQSEIGINLNTNILYTFLMGIYTTIYFGTLYIYLTRKANKRRVIVAIITILYVLSIIQFAIQWWVTVWQFVKNGVTKDSIFNSLFTAPYWVVTATPVLMYLVIILADVLLIWRCFYLWSCSLRVIALPMLLLLAEIGLSISSVAYQAVFPPNIVSLQQSNIINDLLSATLFMSASTSVVTTFMIIYRIYSVTKMNSSSVRQFQHILDIVVQSSALYSLALLVNGIGNALPDSASDSDTQLFALTTWGTVLVLSISGMAPTVMVARVALLEGRVLQPPTAPHLSNLQFRGQSTAKTESQGRMESIMVIESDLTTSLDDKSIIS